MAEGFTHIDSKSNVLCKYYICGACRLGGNCTFSHDSQNSRLSNACKYYLKGNCSYAERCRYDHIPPEKLENLRNNANKSKTDKKGISHVLLVNTSTDKNKVEESKLTTLSTTLSKLCVDVPEFVPRDIHSSTVPTNLVSYAVPAEASSDPEQILNEEPSTPINHDELCPFFQFSGECRLKESCNYIHGLVCEFCQMACLHPSDEEQRRIHTKECMKDMEDERNNSFAIARSKEKQCGICMETIWERNLSTKQRFGILPNCSHCFCLVCIRKWRQSKQFENEIVRSCPECRTQSYYIIPSRYWVDDKEKVEKTKLLENYKSALGVKACKYFKQGKGKCPFSNKCFYLHALAD